MDEKLVERKALEILANAVDRTVGTGFVHAAVVKASQTLTEKDVGKANKAFKMLDSRETRRVRFKAVEAAGMYKELGEGEGSEGAPPEPNPRFANFRSRSAKLGS